MLWTLIHDRFRHKTYPASYVTAAANRIAKLGHDVEVITDQNLDYTSGMGWFSRVELFGPRFGDRDYVMFADLDTVWLRDLDRFEREILSIDADVVGVRDVLAGKWETGLMLVRPGTPAARAIWENAEAIDFRFNLRDMDAAWIWAAADGHHDRFGYIPDDLAFSYKAHVGAMRGARAPSVPVDDLPVLYFHGTPKPHDVAEDPSAMLHSVVREAWRP